MPQYLRPRKCSNNDDLEIPHLMTEGLLLHCLSFSVLVGGILFTLLSWVLSLQGYFYGLCLPWGLEPASSYYLAQALRVPELPSADGLISV